MSSAPGRPYSFPDGVPIEPLPQGTTVLVAGPALSAAEDLVRAMVSHGTTVGEGGLMITTNMTCEKLLTACRHTTPALDVSRLGIIDCSGQEIGQVDAGATVKYVSTQQDLTGIGMKFSALYEELYRGATDGRIRTGLVSLSSLLMYVDLRKLFQFTQTFSGRIDSAGGLGVFSIDPTTQDDRTVNTLGQAADGRIEVREADGESDGELRVRGFRDRSTDWRPFTLE